MAASAAHLSPLSPQSLTTRTRSRKQPFSKLTLLSPSILPSSTPPTRSVLNHRQQHRRGLALAAVACLPSSSSPPKSATPLSTKLYVSGLSFRTTEEGLRNAFQDFGELVEVNLVMDRIANRPRGFAFLRYATVEESQRAIEGMHGKFLDGRVIFVEVAKPRSELRQDSRQTPKQY